MEYQCPLCKECLWVPMVYAKLCRILCAHASSFLFVFRIGCSHTFCACCMLKHLKAKAEEPSRMRSSTGSPTLCPLCKCPIRSPPSTNFFARDAVLAWSGNLGIRPRTDVNVKVDYLKACEIVGLFFALV